MLLSTIHFDIHVPPYFWVKVKARGVYRSVYHRIFLKSGNSTDLGLRKNLNKLPPLWNGGEKIIRETRKEK